MDLLVRGSTHLSGINPWIGWSFGTNPWIYLCVDWQVLSNTIQSMVLDRFVLRGLANLSDPVQC